MKKSPVKRFSRLQKVYENPTSDVYLQFYANALPLFTTYNKFLQRSDPLAHKVASTTGKLIHNIGVMLSGLMLDSVYQIIKKLLNLKENDMNNFAILKL